jgi:uncharacterized protein YecT (DUF1311 family)
MSRIFLFPACMLFLWPVLGSFAAGAAAAEQPAALQTQAEINLKACGEAKQAEDKMKALYEQVLKKYDYDKVFIKNIEAAQKAWEAYRDAHIRALYPYEYRAAYGSAIGACDCAQVVRLTTARIKELQRWVDGTFEGDVCAGSIQKTKLFPPGEKPGK